jgi:hypothetical protein
MKEIEFLESALANIFKIAFFVQVGESVLGTYRIRIKLKHGAIIADFIPSSMAEDVLLKEVLQEIAKPISEIYTFQWG